MGGAIRRASFSRRLRRAVGDYLTLPRLEYESAAIQDLLREVCENGGAGEFLMNGILHLEMPRSHPFWSEIPKRIREATEANKQLG